MTSLSATVEFWCDQNNLGGPLPTFLGGIPTLASFSATESSWTGVLPETWSTLGAGLRQLFLRANDISGSIPNSFSEFRNLNSLTLVDNPRMTGTLPADLCELTFGPLQFFTAECSICLEFLLYDCCDNLDDC
uniref:Uncharacterized protein n=1 Tax=Entomoneis paludosa TaxID=265537 RepID=A0A7S3DTD3_9STRA